MSQARWWQPFERPNWWGMGLCFLSIVLLGAIGEPGAYVGFAGIALLLRERASEMGGWVNLLLVFLAAAAGSLVLQYVMYGEFLI